MHIIQEPTNEAERQDTLRLAGRLIALALLPSSGYSPARAGRIIADAMVEEGKNLMEHDLSHECLALITSAMVERLNQHYENIHNDTKLPLTIWGDDIKAEGAYIEEGEDA
jgi:hypothetical protein